MISGICNMAKTEIIMAFNWGWKAGSCQNPRWWIS
jgi:hypothetical protein